jgi:hypothetical protein
MQQRSVFEPIPKQTKLETTLRSHGSKGWPVARVGLSCRLLAFLKRTSTAVMFGSLISVSQATAKDAAFLVLLNDYDGDAAYFSLYLVAPINRFVRTLWVCGAQERWCKYVGRAQENCSPLQVLQRPPQLSQTFLPENRLDLTPL